MKTRHRGLPNSSKAQLPPIADRRKEESLNTQISPHYTIQCNNNCLHYIILLYEGWDGCLKNQPGCDLRCLEVGLCMRGGKRGQRWGGRGEGVIWFSLQYVPLSALACNTGGTIS
jgi:hypothetical protein